MKKKSDAVEVIASLTRVAIRIDRALVIPSGNMIASTQSPSVCLICAPCLADRVSVLPGR